MLPDIATCNWSGVTGRLGHCYFFTRPQLHVFLANAVNGHERSCVSYLCVIVVNSHIDSITWLLLLLLAGKMHSYSRAIVYMQLVNTMQYCEPPCGRK